MNSRISGAIAFVLAAIAPLQAQDARLQVALDAEQSELVFTLGPVELPAGGHEMIEQPKVQAVALPVSGYLQGFRIELVDRAGREVPSAVLHHLNIIAPQRRELFSRIMQRVGAAGSETGPLELPSLLGYPVDKGDTLLFSVMLHNPTSDSYEDVQLRVRMKYSNPSILAPKIAVQPIYLDVMPPAGSHAYALPPGRSTRSWEGSPAIPGRLLGVGGHMHKYGVALRFEDVTRGKLLWEAKPVTDSAGNVIAMPHKYWLWQLGIRLDPSHVYRLTAEYENPTDQTIEDGAMGTLGGIFVPDERAVWPAVDRHDPEYIADVKVTFARNSGMGLQHHHH